MVDADFILLSGGADDPTVLHQASVHIMEQKNCKTWYADVTVITENMLCAGHRDARSGTCQVSPAVRLFFHPSESLTSSRTNAMSDKCF